MTAASISSTLEARSTRSARSTRATGPAARQRGAVLVTAMVLMVAVLLVGFSAVHAALGDAQSARHERDRQTALRAAEAALLDAEHELEATPASSPRSAALAGAGFVDGCGKAGSDSHGLCTRLSPPSWQTVDLAGDDAALVTYGTFSLRDFGAGAALPPRYLIELIPLNPAYGRFYRITALGFGQRASMRVVLQSFYRTVPAAGAGPPTPPPAPTAPAAPTAGPAQPAAPAEPAPSTPQPEPAPSAQPAAPVPPAPSAAKTPLPTKRIGWREVANWPALHAAATK